MKGFVVYDDAIQGKRPGIVMMHEWWGITSHIHNEAQRSTQIRATGLHHDHCRHVRRRHDCRQPKDGSALSGSVMNDPKVMETRFNAARAQRRASVG